MIFGIILGVLFFLVAILGIVGAVFFFKGNLSLSGYRRGKAVERAEKRPVAGYICTGIAVVSALLFIFIPFGFHTVDAGEIAVVKHLGEAVKVRTAGTYYDFWVTETYEYYDARVQNIDIRDTAYSKDAQTMEITMTVQYQIDPTKGVEIANKYGSGDALSGKIQSVTRDKTKSVLSSYSAMTIIETRNSISPKVEEAIKEAVDSDYYVSINKVVLTNIDFSDSFEKTVEDKMIAEQEKLKAEYEKETAIVNAEKELEVAKLQAEARIAAAQAEAQSAVLVAQAEAQSIKAKSVEIARALGFEILEKEITDGDEVSVEYTISFEGKTAEEIALITDYLKYVEYLNKWNGELPGVLVTDGSAQVILPTT